MDCKHGYIVSGCSACQKSIYIEKIEFALKNAEDIISRDATKQVMADVVKERDEAQAEVERLLAGYPEGETPTDVRNLKVANLEMAQQINDLTHRFNEYINEAEAFRLRCIKKEAERANSNGARASRMEVDNMKLSSALARREEMAKLNLEYLKEQTGCNGWQEAIKLLAQQIPDIPNTNLIKSNDQSVADNEILKNEHRKDVLSLTSNLILLAQADSKKLTKELEAAKTKIESLKIALRSVLELAPNANCIYGAGYTNGERAIYAKAHETLKEKEK